MIYKVRYNIIQGNVFARIDVGNTGISEKEATSFCGVLVMPIEHFKGFRADFERGADLDPANRNIVTFVPDSTIRAAWPT